jgi:hypothetical protein
VRWSTVARKACDSTHPEDGHSSDRNMLVNSNNTQLEILLKCHLLFRYISIKHSSTHGVKHIRGLRYLFLYTGLLKMIVGVFNNLSYTIHLR